MSWKYAAGDNIIDVSTHIRVADPKMLNVDFLVIAHSISNLLVLTNGPGATWGSIEDGRRTLKSSFWWKRWCFCRRSRKDGHGSSLCRGRCWSLLFHVTCDGSWVCWTYYDNENPLAVWFGSISFSVSFSNSWWTLSFFYNGLDMVGKDYNVLCFLPMLLNICRWIPNWCGWFSPPTRLRAWRMLISA